MKLKTNIKTSLLLLSTITLLLACEIKPADSQDKKETSTEKTVVNEKESETVNKETETKEEKVNDDNNFVIKENVSMETNLGTIKIKLYSDIAPKTVENFNKLIAKGYYDGLTFHRVIPNFMIQGGDPNGNGTGGQSAFEDGKAFEDEFSPNARFNKKGLLAMANAGKNTNQSQFFITTKADLSFLNDVHTIFGEVTEGYEIVEKISNVQRNSNDKPLDPVKMTKVTLN